MKYIIANWKMNFNLDDILSWFNKFDSYKTQIPKDKEIILAPSFPYLPITKEYSESYTKISSQDISRYEKGQKTGAVGNFQLMDFCQYCIVGHSERKENKEAVQKKREMCLTSGLIPIVCFVNPDEVLDYYKEGCLLAWEDPANISQDGVYKEKSPKEIENNVKSIREKIPTGAVLIYGGSVNRNNIKNLSKIEGLDGVLVGHASTDPVHFWDLISQS